MDDPIVSQIQYNNVPTPKTPADFEILHLLHQVQAHTLPVGNMYLLSFILNIPFLSLDDKLAIYNFLTGNHLPLLSSVHLNVISLMLLWMFGPIIPLLIIGLIIYVTPKVIRRLLKLILKRFFKQELSPKVFLELTFPADTSKSAYATQQLHTLLHSLARQKSLTEKLLKQEKQYALEIVSTRQSGIKYLLIVPKTQAEIIQRSLISYLPGIKVKPVSDYLNKQQPGVTGISELKLSGHFSLPLTKQTILN